MIRLLASVRDADEASIAFEGGADIIDFKEPSVGALGALAPEIISGALRGIAGKVVTSATAGDWPLDPAALIGAVDRIGATGVDYVKLGLLPGGELEDCIDALAPLATQYRLVAVFFADRGVPLASLEALRRSGFAGAMIDTFDKRNGGLREHLDETALRAFVTTARGLGLMIGLAGSLRLDDIPALAALGPDLLGFRGALCEASRNGMLSPALLTRLRATMNSVREAQSKQLAIAQI